jgi:hypothetical protein
MGTDPDVLMAMTEEQFSAHLKARSAEVGHLSYADLVAKWNAELAEQFPGMTTGEILVALNETLLPPDEFASDDWRESYGLPVTRGFKTEDEYLTEGLEPWQKVRTI